MGINVESMDIEDHFTDYPNHPHHDHNAPSALDIAEFREQQCATPTPERERQKARERRKAIGLKGLMNLTRKPAATTGTSATIATAHKSLLRRRTARSYRRLTLLVDTLPLVSGRQHRYVAAPQAMVVRENVLSI